FSTSPLSVGNHNITADFDGTTHFIRSSGQTTQTVDVLVSIDDVTVTEGKPGDKIVATFKVKLSEPSSLPVTVDFATMSGSASPITDYTTTNGTLIFAPQFTEQTVDVDITSDNAAEPGETFFVNLSSPTNAFIATGNGPGTIVDDDPAPSISINDVSATEGDSGTVPLVFT